MRLAYDEPELDIEAKTCFNEEEIQCLEKQIQKLEGKTQQQKNPHNRTPWGCQKCLGHLLNAISMFGLRLATPLAVVFIHQH